MPNILPVHSEAASARDRELLGLALSTGGEGWDFRIGDPEIFANRERLVRPGGRVLDVGMGYARSSLFFAMHDMVVEGYDIDGESVEFMNGLAEKYGLPLSSEQADITEIDFGEEQYDVVVISQALMHFDSTEKAYEVIAKSIRALRPGGHIYLRVAGKADDEWQRAVAWGDALSETDPNVYYEFCGCSGLYQEEAHLHFDAVELMRFLVDRNMEFVDTGVLPMRGKVNVMYGEDWHARPLPSETRQLITLLAQKQ